MNRRSLLAAGTAGALLGASGCLEGLDSLAGSSDDESVPDCTEHASWDDDTTSGPAEPDPDSIAGRLDCAGAARPEPTGDVCETFELETEDGETEEVHSVGVEPYPEPPTAFDEESLIEYVYAYEDAYQQNTAVSEYGERAIGAGAEILDDWGDPTRVLDLYDQITVIGIGFSSPVSYVTLDGGFVGDDHLSDAAVYGVDETGVVRLHESYLDRDGNVAEEAPDPLEDGELLECF